MLVPYLIKDEPDLEPMAVIRRSKELMDGHKWNYVVFELSFIGWELLCVLTLGILSIWIVPYYTTAKVMYYEELKKISK